MKYAPDDLALTKENGLGLYWVPIFVYEREKVKSE